MITKSIGIILVYNSLTEESGRQRCLPKEMVESRLALGNEGKSIRLKTKGTAHKQGTQVDTVVVQSSGVNNSDTSTNTYATLIEQFSK